MAQLLTFIGQGKTASKAVEDAYVQANEYLDDKHIASEVSASMTMFPVPGFDHRQTIYGWDTTYTFTLTFKAIEKAQTTNDNAEEEETSEC